MYSVKAAGPSTPIGLVSVPGLEGVRPYKLMERANVHGTLDVQMHPIVELVDLQGRTCTWS